MHMRITGNGRQQTRHCAYIAIVLYSRPKLLSRLHGLVSDTRSVQMLRAGYVLCRALVLSMIVHGPENEKAHISVVKLCGGGVVSLRTRLFSSCPVIDSRRPVEV